MTKLWDRLPRGAVEFIDIFTIQVEQGLKKTNFRFGTALDCWTQWPPEGPSDFSFSVIINITPLKIMILHKKLYGFIQHFWSTDKPFLERGTTYFYEERLLSSKVPSCVRPGISKALLFLDQFVLMQPSTLRHVQLMNHNPKALEWKRESEKFGRIQNQLTFGACKSSWSSQQTWTRLW